MKNKRSLSGVRRKAPLRVQKACVNCRKRKQACDDARPCKRCTAKGIECREVSHDYDQPEHKRSRVPQDVFLHDDEEYDQFDFDDSNHRKMRDDYDSDGSMYEGSDSDESHVSESSDELDSEVPNLSSSSSSVPSPESSLDMAPDASAHSLAVPPHGPRGSPALILSPGKRERRPVPKAREDDAAALTFALSNSVASLTFGARPQLAQPIMVQRSVSLPDSTRVESSAFQAPAHSQPVPIAQQPHQAAHRRVSGLALGSSGGRTVVAPPHPLRASVSLPAHPSKSYAELYGFQSSERVALPGLSLDFLLPFWHDLASINRAPATEPWNGPAGSPMTTPAGSPVEDSMSALYTNEPLYGLDFPFHTSVRRRRSLSIADDSLPEFMGFGRLAAGAEPAGRMNAALHGTWRQFVQRSRGRKVQLELAQAKQAWQHVMDLLRAMDYGRVQLALQTMQLAATAGKELFGDNITPGILCWSSCGRIHHANQAFSNMVGYTLDEIRASGEIGAHLLFHPEDLATLLRRQLEALQYPESSSYCLDARLRGRFGHEARVSVCVANLRDQLGMPLLTVGHFTTKA
eukprot:TRINITY_DN5741_c0_g1_i1.p1 TRINITY_DN5741_c0_g1~~TRINITY_DN5741_c0_g1_i1.p1  ORF type:complete len:575 (-),score=147.05 TRINITY_DN5741_c0_g1_i1:714-2438(-)